MLWITDPDGLCTYISRGWLEFTGQRLSEALPTDLQQAAYGMVIAAGVSSDRRTWTQDEVPTITTVAPAVYGFSAARRAISATIW